jgi:hypothetical protein
VQGTIDMMEEHVLLPDDPTIRSNDLLTIATERTFEIFTMEKVGATTFGVSVPKGGGCW